MTEAINEIYARKLTPKRIGAAIGLVVGLGLGVYTAETSDSNAGFQIQVIGDCIGVPLVGAVSGAGVGYQIEEMGRLKRPRSEKEIDAIVADFDIPDSPEGLK